MRWRVRFDGTTVRLYVDGVQVGSAPAPVPGGAIQYGLQENRLARGALSPGRSVRSERVSVPRRDRRGAALQPGADRRRGRLPPECGCNDSAEPSDPRRWRRWRWRWRRRWRWRPVPNLRIVSTGGGGSAYQCLPSGAVDRTVSFSWWRLSDIATIDPRTGVESNRSVKVASGATLVIPPSRARQQVLLRGRRRRAARVERHELLSGLKNRPVIQLKPAYGNFRVRGIDVFQIVQPSSGAQTFGYDPNAPLTSIPFGAFCGGGTPTSYRQTGQPGAAVRSSGATAAGSRTAACASTSASRRPRLCTSAWHNLLSSRSGSAAGRDAERARRRPRLERGDHDDDHATRRSRRHFGSPLAERGDSELWRPLRRAGVLARGRRPERRASPRPRRPASRCRSERAPDRLVNAMEESTRAAPPTTVSASTACRCTTTCRT